MERFPVTHDAARPTAPWLAAVRAKARGLAHVAWPSRFSWRDIVDLMTPPAPIGHLPGDPLTRLGIAPAELSSAPDPVEFVGRTLYLNGASAVVTHTVDDSTRYMTACLDAADAYGIKVTVFVDTREAGFKNLWPRLRQAVADGHEVGAHSRRHPCRVPETPFFCLLSVNRYEIVGARDDILAHTAQPYVWSWAYPCGNCATRRFVQRRVAHAGYILARAYSHHLPDLQTFDPNPYAAGFTQTVERGHTDVDRHGAESALPGQMDVATVNAKFDEVYAAGGIYSFVSHPQCLDYGPDGFYERHLAHVGGRADVWYVPMGPLYAYRTLAEHTAVRPLTSKGARARFAVVHRLDAGTYNGSVTLAFRTTVPVRVAAGGQELSERPAGPVRRWDGQYYRSAGAELLVTVRPGTILEFR